MLFEDNWIMELEAKYRRANGAPKYFPSDWDITDEKVPFPSALMKLSLEESFISSNRYSFAEDQHENKETIMADLRCRGIQIDQNNITITISSTASLYLTASILFRKGIRRYLVLTPTYYTILDTLNDLGASVFYEHLLDSNGFAISIEKVLSAIEQQNIQAVLICDPVYSAGVEVEEDVIYQLVKKSKELNFWIVCDSTIAGLEWTRDCPEIMCYSKIKVLMDCNKFIYIESLPKRLFINGLKHSVIICGCGLAPEIENLASQVYGGFCAPQLELYKSLYDPQNTPELRSLVRDHLTSIKNNYQLLSAFLADTPYEIYETNSGYFSMIVHREYLLNEVEVGKMVQMFLEEEQMLILPSSHFAFYKKNKFGFRVNLMKDPLLYLLPLEHCVRKNVKRFK